MSGDMPDNTCPVIMPGRETSPTANNEFTTGIIAASNAFRRASTQGRPDSSSDASLSAAMLIAVIEPEKIIPASGTT